LFEIIEKRQLSHTVALFRIKAPMIAQKRKAGQFIIIRVNEHGERIPLTIVDSDNKEGTITSYHRRLERPPLCWATLKRATA